MTEKTHHLDSKYNQVARWLQTRSGRLLDIGARDRILQRHLLNPEQIQYVSADASPGCDFQVDLEKPLEFKDAEFDHVVALDVLEHVEHAHSAFAELVRISRGTVIIALPNMATLTRRIKFLYNGDFGTDKYALYPTHQGDRHRWLTVYNDIIPFYEGLAKIHNLDVTLMANEVILAKLRPLGRVVHKFGLPGCGAMTERVTVLFTKR